MSAVRVVRLPRQTIVLALAGAQSTGEITQTEYDEALRWMARPDGCVGEAHRG